MNRIYQRLFDVKSILSGLLFLISTALVAQPTITSFSPASGPIGTTVTIIGTNFSTTQTNNIVFFGATKATVSAASTTQLTVNVPTGATYEPISILVNGLIAYSNTSFDVTFPGGGTIYSRSFAAGVDFTGSSPYDVAVADFDQDGKPDIAVLNYFYGSIDIYKNTSTPGQITSSSFASPVNFPDNPDNNDTGNAIAIGDVDGDGRADIIVTTRNTNHISIYKNTSTPGVIDASSFAPKVDFDAGINWDPVGIAIGDLDGDGKPEIAIANTSKSWVSVFRNTSTQGVIDINSFATLVTFGTGTNPYDVFIGDVDKDG